MNAVATQSRARRVPGHRGWSVPRKWKGETAVLFGGGPSLNRNDVQHAIDRGWRRIAINNAYRLDTEADALVWGDQRWYFWNRHHLQYHTGPYKITWLWVPPTRGIQFHMLKHVNGSAPMASDPGQVTATNSGQGAMNVAFHFGVKRIILLGFDMKMAERDGKLVHNWHDLHKRNSAQHRYKEVFGPAIRKAAEWLEERGVSVINCTPDSALTGVPMMNLREVA